MPQNSLIVSKWLEGYFNKYFHNHIYFTAIFGSNLTLLSCSEELSNIFLRYDTEKNENLYRNEHYQKILDKERYKRRYDGHSYYDSAAKEWVSVNNYAFKEIIMRYFCGDFENMIKNKAKEFIEEWRHNFFSTINNRSKFTRLFFSTKKAKCCKQKLSCKKPIYAMF